MPERIITIDYRVEGNVPYNGTIRLTYTPSPTYDREQATEDAFSIMPETARWTAFSNRPFDETEDTHVWG